MIEKIRQRLPRFKPRAAASYALVAVLAFALAALIFRQSAADGEAGHGERAANGTITDAASGHKADGADATTWTCAMHPQIRQPQPGQCPICGMDLIPVEAGGDTKQAAERLTLSERAKTLAQVRTTEVRRMADANREVRLLGRIEPDERTTKTITAWVGGRIERLHVRVTGERVRAGQTVATLYSPEVLAAQQDLIAAGRQVGRMKGASDMARAAAQAALDASRDRLRLLGVSDDRLRAMEAASQPARQIAVHSPFAGTVIERLASEGAYVTTGEPLYRIADLSRVWVQLDAYERDLASLRVEQAVQVRVDSLPDESFEGRVAFIDPTIDPERRTARVRVEVPNPDGRLRPGTFAQAVVQGQAGAPAEQPLVIPHTAPLFTGRRSVVYVQVPDTERPTYEARVVRMGPRAGAVYPVVAGLALGERVVTRGAFVLDADLQIRGGASMMTLPDDTEAGPWEKVIELAPDERQKLRPLVDAYIGLQQALASDDLAAAHKAAKSLASNAADTNIKHPQSAMEGWRSLAPELRKQAEHISHADSLESARGSFELLTDQMTTLLRRFGNPSEDPLQLAYCPMAAGAGAIWIQKGTEIVNPYFGRSMLNCGDLREEVPPRAYLRGPAAASKPSPKAPEGHQH